MQRLYFVLFLLFFIPISAFGQVPTAIDSIEINMSPESPAPGQQVTIKVASYSLDLTRSSIVWLIDGKQAQSGTGLDTFTINAPTNGKSTTVGIAIRTAAGRDLRRNVVIRPGDVSIAWEAIGYTPPLFKGKGLPSYQGSIHFVAVPELYKNGTRINPQDLIYTWKKGSTVLGSNSGYGKQDVVIAGNVVPEPMTVRVDVQSRDGLTRGAGTVVVDFYDPEVQFYKEDPLYGVLYNRALIDQEPLTNNEFKVTAAPYNFSDVGSYNWSINGDIQPDLNTQKSITFRNNGNVSGQTLIGLEIRSARNILQSAKRDFTVYFSKRTSEQE